MIAVTSNPLRCVGLNFADKTERVVDPAQIAQAIADGLYVWLDVDVADAAARQALLQTGWLSDPLREAVLQDDLGTQQSRHPDCLHLTLCGCVVEGDDLRVHRLDALLGRGYLLTVHRGPVGFLDHVLREYSADFTSHARTPSFLVYELWDHLLDNCQGVSQKLEQQVERLQRELMRQVDDVVFQRLSALGSVLLHFRGMLVPVRSVLSELATRRSEFVSEQTQPFLANMVGTAERLLQDTTVDREALSEALNLHTSMVAHRTNLIVKRLTIFSVVFLPLTFLCGFYGMNFEHMPEIGWKYGYVMFWTFVAAITSTQLYFLWRKKWF